MAELGPEADPGRGGEQDVRLRLFRAELVPKRKRPLVLRLLAPELFRLADQTVGVVDGVRAQELVLEGLLVQRLPDLVFDVIEKLGAEVDVASVGANSNVVA
jgi:hypothetical protein